MNPTDSAEMMAAICDVLLPGDGHFPKASVTGTQAVVANRLRERYGGVIFANLAEDLTVEGRGFTELSDEERVAALRKLETEKPEFFGYLLTAAYLAYYATPPVIEAIRLEGHIYNDAPQPLGYELKPFSFTPGLDLPLVPRGWFKWTDMVQRIDIASLAELDLPTRESARVSRLDPVDVAIVGSGMGGAVAALRLAQQGLKVVCLEQGGWTSPAAHPHARTDYEWERLTSFATSPNIRQWETDYPVDTRDEVTLMWNGVGGSTVHYTATWPRLRPSDFRKGVEHGCQPDWPFSYEDLESYYDQVDRASGIAGCMGDPAMPERMPFQTRPVSAGPMGPVVARGFDRLGWHWWPMPEAILADPYDGRLPCNNCGNCQSGCPRGSLNDMSFTYWPKALAAGAQLRTLSRVERVESDDAGRATGVVYIDLMSGQRFFQAAKVVVLAANGVGTPRLMLLSESSRFPNGLANGNGLVGRHLMHHGLAIVEGWVDDVTDPHKGVESAVHICSEFAETDVARGFINGFTMHIVRMNGAGFQALGSHSRHTIPWGAGHHAEFRKRFGHGISVVCMGDDLPLPENRVTLSETVIDSSGLPAPKIVYRLHPNDRRMMDFAIDRAVDLLNACDAWDIAINRWDRFGMDYAPPAFHLYGTCRMGVHPETSVTNEFGQTWESPNLFVMDGSLMPTGGAINPTSTIGAVALRCADHLATHFAEIG